MLLNKRLDLDIARTRLRKAHEAEQESRVSLFSDYDPNVFTVKSTHQNFSVCVSEPEFQPAGRRLPVPHVLHVQLPACQMVEGSWLFKEPRTTYLNRLHHLLCLSHPIRCGHRKSLR